jgi:hypothetical protein
MSAMGHLQTLRFGRSSFLVRVIELVDLFLYLQQRDWPNVYARSVKSSAHRFI